MMAMAPRYPDVTVRLRTRNPFALVSAVRLGLRRSSVEAEEIRRFTEEALEHEKADEVRDVCARWARLDLADA